VDNPEGRLSRVTAIGWATGGFGTSIYVGATMAYLLFYLTEAHGINPAVAGLAILIPRLVDVVTDPIMGVISDRTRSRMGRRRPYLLWGALTFGVSFFLLFAMPAGMPHAVAYFVAVYLLASTAYTVFVIPHNAMGAELTPDARERTGVIGYKMMAARLGIIAVTVFGSYIFTRYGTLAEGFAMFGLIFGSLILVSGLTAFFATSGTTGTAPGHTGRGLGSEFRSIVHNRPLLILLCVFLLQNMAIGAGATAGIYLITLYVQVPLEHAGMIIASVGIVAALATPFWIPIAKRFGKIVSYRVGMLIAMASFLSILLFVGPGSLPLLLALLMLQGVGDAVLQLAPNSMVPDTVEYAELKTGARHEGVILGTMYATLKLGMAAGSFVTSILLDLTGFQSGVGAAGQTPEAIEGIKLAYTIAPLALWTCAFLVLRYYRLDEASHLELRRQILQRAN